MKAITAFLEDFDFSKILPKIGNLIKDIRFWINFMMLIAPLAVLGFGLWYFLKPLKEANHKLGFRTYFGMGSIEAWKFTQRLAGIVWIALGGGGAVISLVMLLLYSKKPVILLANHSLIWLAIFALLTVASYVTVSLIAMSRFDAHGEPKQKKE